MTEQEKKELREHLIEQDKRTAFMRHLYHAYGRNNPEHPMHGFYTGLWQEFKEEAALIVREQFFDRLEAVRLYEENKAKEQANVYTSTPPESDSNAVATAESATA
tara:strand:+ start:146 stop:460 length:315 start_codon:yes stop_codon:yes gene_type:complete